MDEVVKNVDGRRVTTEGEDDDPNEDDKDA